MWRLKQVQKVVKTYSSELTAVLRGNRIDVLRLHPFKLEPPSLVISLTHDWKTTGRPVEWGLDIIWNKLSACDMWRDPGFIERFMKENEQADASAERARKNSQEAFLYDFASQFKKTFSNTIIH